ncbi:NADPH:quinone oxidoreductase family protein [soil metagenome]
MVRSWVATTLTGEDGLELQDSPAVVCGPGQVRIRNRALALNFPDCLITRGLYQLKVDPPFVPGSECAGDVLEVGADIRGIRVGDRVLSLCGVGAFTDEVVVTPPMQQVHVIPDEMSYAEAAAFAMTYGTGLHALRQRGRLEAGETVLVLGSAGGCGSAAVGIAAAMGARVIAGASSAEKCAVARAAGAHETIGYSTEPLRDRVMELTGGAGVDVVFDPVGDKLFDEAKRCIAWNGRYLVIGFAGGDIPTLGANYTILKSMSLVGVAFGMSAIKDPATNADNFHQLFQWYAEGRLRPHVGTVTTFDQLPQAAAELYAGRAVGKTVIEI